MIWCKSHIWTSQTVGDQLEHIVVVCQTSCGRRHSKISVLWQDNVLRSDAHLKVLLIVRHPVVEENSQSVLEVLNLGSHLKMWCFPLILKGDTHRERLVPEVPQAPCQLLGGAIVLTINKSAFSRHLKHPHLMIKVFGAIIGHGHYVGIVVLVVIVEAVEEEAKPNPAVNGPVYMPSGRALSALKKNSKYQAFQADLTFIPLPQCTKKPTHLPQSFLFPLL